ncbi:glycosyltransferase [Mycobacterium sp. SP-6446]|uniref:glycosyltransferase n=1 Tax=Mycobacterium sp. SP-6446 TaxID=1834162 RepID=UPI000970065F|nr:glycosyltransferase [Mycobacterium sp. SP-6446]OMC09432.1 glycosyltransferase [Mycobacterium sp. SP-6446]
MKFVLAAYGGRGDVEPCVAVGRELLRRGHEVCLAVPPNIVHFAKSAGLIAVAYGPDTREQMDGAMNFIGGVGSLISALPQLVERVSRVWLDKGATLTSLATGADLLVAHMNDQMLAANVAEYHAIPLAALHVFPARILASGPLYSGITKDAEVAQRRALGLPEVPGPLAPQLADGGLLEIQTYDELCLPGQPSQWVEPGRRPFVGALTLELPTDADDDVLAWIATGTPPIYFGFGSTPIDSPADMAAMIGAACAQLGERALICSGASDFSHVPHFDHVKVVGALNYAEIFPACRAVVHHGGSGTTAAGLRAGVPTLILWAVWDQPMWAAALEQLKIGVGRQFSATTRESLVTDLRSILVPECVARAREVATQMTTPAESVARAADLLEDAARLGH